MAKRGHGEGTVFERKDRPGVWRAQFSYIDPATGKAVRKSFDRPSRKEALAAGKEWFKHVDGGLLPNADKLTLGEWIDRWLEDYAKPELRIKSFDKYKSCLNCYIKPVLGNIKLAKIQSPDIQRVFNKMTVDGGKKGEGVSTSTVKATRRYLSMCLDQAIKIGLATKNVCTDTKPPKLTKKEIMPLTEEQSQKLAAAAKSFGEVAHMAVLLTLNTGMRLGEVFGLKWDCVDFKAGFVIVKRSLATGKGQLLQEPKTPSSRRKIPLTTDVIKEFRKYKKWQEWHMHSMGDKWENNDFVFANIVGRVISTSNFTKRCFKPALKKAGIDQRVKFHDLRHTHATLLMAKGINVKIVQERLGHSNISMTLDTYSHLTPDMQMEAVRALEGVFTKAN